MSANTFGYTWATADCKILDPGTGNKITVIESGCVCPIVTAGAETNTITAPTKEGIVTVLTMITDGGDRVVTAPAALNVTGNTIMTFNDVRDTIVLISVPVAGGTFRWHIICNDGVSLS
jgi:hypothetical protein